MIKISALKRIVAIAAAAVLAAVLFICFLVIDAPPKLDYSVIIPDNGNILFVTLEVSNPLFSKTKTMPLLMADKRIRISSCINPAGRPREVWFEGADVVIPVKRGGRTIVSYIVELSAQGKHGAQGEITADYAVFDGEQAFLLPSEFYGYENALNESINISEISFSFDLPDGWEQITHIPDIKGPRWIDMYSITKDAFVFGKFWKYPDTEPGLEAFALPGAAGAINSETVEALNSLFTYYSELFGSSPEQYSIVMLPKPDDAGSPVIGGAGTHSVAASFDPGAPRDWQLVSHRMFHAFFDTAAPYASFHIEPNLWFYEGLATYYENMSIDAIPEPLRQRLDISPDRQMALLFDRYLYMRIKDPTIYSFTPMQEEDLASDALVEFLHYTTAPLLLKLLEDKSRETGGAADSALRFCLGNAGGFSDRLVAIDSAESLLGTDDGREFCKTYLLSPGVPALWHLKAYQPPDDVVLAELNDFEFVMGTWFQQYNEDYPIDNISKEQLDQATADAGSKQAAFVTADMKRRIADYSRVVYVLLNDYYYRAKQKGIDFLDTDLRKKMLVGE